MGGHHVEAAIVLLGSDSLGRVARNVTQSDLDAVECQTLVDKMISTMRVAGGVGIAAPQLGHSLSVAVIEDQTARVDKRLADRDLRIVDLTVFINPRIIARSDEVVTHFEGCLSTPGYHAAVSRHKMVTITWMDLQGQPHQETYYGWPARIVQHEIAHLHGRTIFDDCLTGGIVHESILREVWNERGIGAFVEHLARNVDVAAEMLS
jgi:peptide deformylase